MGSTPGSGRVPGGTPLQYACLGKPPERGAWWAAVPAVAESDTTEVTWHTRSLLFVPRNLLKREVISPSQLLSFSKLPEPTSLAASRAAEVMEASVQEAVRRGHLQSGPSRLPTGERPGGKAEHGELGRVLAGHEAWAAHWLTGQASSS